MRRKKSLKLFTFSIIGIFIIFNLILSTTNQNSSKISLINPSEMVNSSHEFFFEVNGSIICNEAGSQTTPEICSDGEGGSIIIWDDTRSRNSDIYGQRIDSEGTFLWGDNGTAICTSRDPTAIEIISDGNGGVIVVWMTSYNGSAGTAYIFAQKVNSTGNIQWNPNGVLVTNGSANLFDLRVCSDEAGGFIASWDGDKFYQVYAQRINSNGDPVWSIGGVAVAQLYSGKMRPRICSDMTGGAIISWEDDQIGGYYRMYCQRINSSGYLQWGSTGRAVTGYGPRSQVFDEIASDGAGGAYISWSETYTWVQVYVQHMSASGNAQWSSGKEVGTPYWYNYYSKMCSDGAGGVFVIWKDNALEYIHAQRLKADGNLAWSSDGIDICKLSGSEYWYEIKYNGFGGAFITWVDDRSGNWDIYSQGISATGDLLWKENGKLICSAVNTQKEPEIVNDGEGGAFITWQDYRDGGWDVYLQHSKNEKPTSNILTGITTSIMSLETINWILYDDFAGGEYRVIANNTEGNFYTWQDWTSWNNNTPLNVPINRSTVGIFNYTIEYRDIAGEFGNSSTVIVELLPDDIPTSSQPGPVSTRATGSEVITWTLYDDYGAGQYRVLANITGGSASVWQNWDSWINNTAFDVPIYRTTPGVFNYTIEYYDVYNNYGIQDTVIVTVINDPPISTHPNDMTIDFNQTISLGWVLTDDFGPGEYRILVYNSEGTLISSSIWESWAYFNYIDVPVDNKRPGTFNYTIEFFDLYNVFGISDSVLVTVREQDISPMIPMGNYYIYIMLIGICSLVYLRKRKINRIIK